ncbi:MAG: hypothetical protein AAF940_05425 [Pseudomonadota bacterium]
MKTKFDRPIPDRNRLHHKDLRLADHLELIGKSLLYITLIPTIVIATMMTAYYFPTMPQGMI